MQEILMSLIAGLICGIAFTLLKLPIPAPPVFSAICGIVGVFGGMKLVQLFI
ncbi:XapX domain-containing protein [Gottfriedia sp. NPDC057991]|uniref:XapX domain-containing protein n=1 Tax=Gottfriedia sp. NPDC057991 TaxID=3346298 RepID=UPI0036DF40AC